MEELAGKDLDSGSQKSTRTPMVGVLGGGGRLKKVMVMLKTVDGSTRTLAPANMKVWRKMVRTGDYARGSGYPERE
jgi:hypothetical protein